jgi:hypothetical protein
MGQNDCMKNSHEGTKYTKKDHSFSLCVLCILCTFVRNIGNKAFVVTIYLVLALDS